MIKLKLPFGKREEFPEQFFALDLGGRVLKALVLNSSKGAVSSLGSRKITRGEQDEDGVSSFKEAIGELREDFPEAEPQAVVGISGPQSRAFTTVVRSATTKDINELSKLARQQALATAERELRRSFGVTKLAVSELEAQILEIKEADKLEVYLFTSFATEDFLSQQADLVKHAGLTLWGYSSLAFNVVTELSKLEVGELNALVFDIGGSKTEISLAFGNQLMETQSFYWDFVENGNPAAFLDLWLEAVSASLSEFDGVDAFPSKIFLTGGASSFPGLLEVVSSYPWSRDHPFDVAPEIVTLDADRLPLSLGQVALRVKEETE